MNDKDGGGNDAVQGRTEAPIGRPSPSPKASVLDDIFSEIIKEFDLMFHCRIPVEKHWVKKNNRPIFVSPTTGKPFIGKSKELRQAEQYLTFRLKSEANRMGLSKPIEGPVWCCFFFRIEKSQFYNKDGSTKQTNGDLSNLYEIVQDCLQESGIIKNDAQIMAHDLSRKLPGDSTELEVSIFQHKNIKPPVRVAKQRKTDG